MPELMKVIRREGWSENAPGGEEIERTDVKCPYFPDQPVYDSSVTDNQRASFDPTANRRGDIQALSLGRGWYCIDYAFRMTAVPTFRNDWGWNLVGPEVHDSGLPQATIQPQVLPYSTVGPQGTQTPYRRSDLPPGGLRYFLDANAGKAPHRYFDLGPAPVGVTDDAWGGFRMVFNYTEQTDGVIRVFRHDPEDDVWVLMVTVNGPTVDGKAPGGWIKIANYSREAWVDGLQRVQTAGRVYKMANGSDLPPYPEYQLEEEPPPPPPPSDTPCDEVRAQLALTLAEMDELEGDVVELEGIVAEVTIERDAARGERDAHLARLVQIHALSA